MSEEKNVPKLRFPGFTEPWEQRKLGEYVSITSGEAPSKFEVGTELYVKVDDLNYNDKYVVDTQNKVAEHSTVKRVTKGSVVFPKRGAAIMTNKVRIMGIDGYMDTNMMALTSEKLDSEFLYNIISKEGLYKIADTSTIPQINNKHVEPYEVTIPSLDEQRKIGAYFKQLDHLITLHQRKLGHVKDLKKSMLQKMFPKNGELYPEVRFPGFTAAWEQRKFSDLVQIERGGSPRPIDDFITDSPDGLNWVKIGDAPAQGNRITKTAEKIKPEGLPKTKKVHPGDLILSNSMSFGKPYIMGIDGCIHDGWLLIRNTNNVFDLTFLCRLLGTPQMLNQYRSLAAGSTVNNLNKELVGNTVVTIPKIDEQRVLGQYLEQLDRLITLHQRELDHLQLLKKGMLQQMFV